MKMAAKMPVAKLQGIRVYAALHEKFIWQFANDWCAGHSILQVWTGLKPSVQSID